jgi:hypothetical protein
MPRTMASAGVTAWRMEQLINDLAEASETDAEFSAEYDMMEQSVRAFKWRHKLDIQAEKKDLRSEYNHIWFTKVGNRLRLLTLRLEEIEHQIELLHDHAQREPTTSAGLTPMPQGYASGATNTGPTRKNSGH